MGEKIRGKEIKASARIIRKLDLWSEERLISPCSDLTWELL